jgi:hypothetical protein
MVVAGVTFMTIHLAVEIMQQPATVMQAGLKQRGPL